MEEIKKRVYCLYRVSTKGQVEKDDIPMQKQCCREYAEHQGWEIIREFSEKGVSGFKVSAKDRDAIQEIQQDAAQGKFDVLLVYMFDRLGRREDETPFVVEWFVRNGVEVWSTIEGQQRFDNHVDKLMNYIRYWQASGESIKTSIRTKTRLGQIVQEGRFRGGSAPYGYRLEKQGRTNRRNQEVYEIVIDENEAAVVQLIFRKYVYEGFGAQRLNRWLYEQGFRNRTGTNFTNTTIIKMLKNIMYEGILRSGETQSEVFPELQIVTREVYERTQEIMAARTQKRSDVPFNSKGKALLSGMVYCAHCGSKLVLTTASGKRKGADGKRETRLRYCCHNKIRHPQDCDGQTGYETEKLDSLIEKLVMMTLQNISAIPEGELVAHQLEKQLAESKAALQQIETLHAAKSKELESYKAEVYKAIQKTSVWSPELLNELIDAAKARLEELETEMSKAREGIENLEQSAEKLRGEYKRILSWADLFQGGSRETKKMIIRQMISKVHIGRDFKLDVDFAISFSQFESLQHRETQVDKKSA